MNLEKHFQQKLYNTQQMRNYHQKFTMKLEVFLHSCIQLADIVVYVWTKIQYNIMNVFRNRKTSRVVFLILYTLYESSSC